MIIGVMSAPELVALIPSTPWKTSGVNRIEPNMPNAVRKPTIIDTVNVVFLKSSSGTMGCSTRPSTKTNAASIAAAKASRPTTWGEVQAWSRVGDDGEDRGEQPPAEDALDASEHDQLGHVLRHPTHHGGGDEADHPREQERLTAEEVAELAGDRGHGGRRHQIGGGDPGQAVEAVQLGHDARHGGAHDLLVPRGHQQLP